MAYVPGPRGSHRFESARAARVAAVQALFQIETTRGGQEGEQRETIQDEASRIIQEFEENRLSSDDYPYAPYGMLFTYLVTNVAEHYRDVQYLVAENLADEWSLDTLDPVLRAILLIGAGELSHKFQDLPAPVVISEYVDIARGFCGEKEGGFANRVLDQVAQRLELPLAAPNPH